MLDIIKREFRVALSKKCQPWWFRVGKWVFVLVVCIVFYGSDRFWPWMLGLLVVGLLTHFIYRRQTHCWTRPWGGWKDLDAGR